MLKPETKFIVADEISTMLDVITQQEIWNIVLRFARDNGVGVLAITHNKHLARAVCSRIVNLEDLNGRIRNDQILSNLLESQI
jgi:peptide/nickel transport system ATP-binding protein